MSTESDKPEKKRSWRDDYFASCEVIAQWWGVFPIIPLAIILLTSALAWLLSPDISWLKPRSAAVVYAAQDQVYAEPILQEFTRQTGIKVRAVYDSEAVKTVGLANRLLAERSHPQCDVFWGNEELRTRQLAAREVFRETNGWAVFGYRSRRVAIHTNRLEGATVPRTLLELTNSSWHHKVSLAYPMFGTTATHFMALRQHWGAERWEAWCRGLAANQPFFEEGNSMVVKRLARGEAWLGLTDSDDLAAAQREGLQIGQTLPINEETLLIPNTVAVVRRASHPEAAERLFVYLQSPEVMQKLVAAHALEGVSTSEVATLTLQPDWAALLRDLESATTRLKEIFLR